MRYLLTGIGLLTLASSITSGPALADHKCPRIPGTNIVLPICAQTHGTQASSEAKICEPQYASPQFTLLSKSPIKATGQKTKVAYLVRMNPGDWKTCTKGRWKPQGWRMKVNFLRVGAGPSEAHQYQVTLNAKGAHVGSSLLPAGKWRATTWLISPVTQTKSASSDFAILYKASLSTFKLKTP